MVDVFHVSSQTNTQIGLSALSGKTQAWPWPHNKTGLGPSRSQLLHFSTIPVANVVYCDVPNVFQLEQSQIQSNLKNLK
jgi:hypothetical protein